MDIDLLLVFLVSFHYWYPIPYRETAHQPRSLVRDHQAFANLERLVEKEVFCERKKGPGANEPRSTAEKAQMSSE